MITSAITNIGVIDLWHLILQHRQITTADGSLEKLRSKQNRKWMKSLIEELNKALVA